jgi:hypothetical protein
MHFWHINLSYNGRLFFCQCLVSLECFISWNTGFVLNKYVLPLFINCKRLIRKENKGILNTIVGMCVKLVMLLIYIPLSKLCSIEARPSPDSGWVSRGISPHLTNPNLRYYLHSLPVDPILSQFNQAYFLQVALILWGLEMEISCVNSSLPYKIRDPLITTL